MNIDGTLERRAVHADRFFCFLLRCFGPYNNHASFCGTVGVKIKVPITMVQKFGAHQRKSSILAKGWIRVALENRPAPETNRLHLKMAGWKTFSFPFGMAYFQV